MTHSSIDIGLLAHGLHNNSHRTLVLARIRANPLCVDNNIILRIITEQSIEWNSPLYLIFIDFQTAFDSITHSSIWKALINASIGFC